MQLQPLSARQKQIVSIFLLVFCAWASFQLYHAARAGIECAFGRQALQARDYRAAIRYLAESIREGPANAHYCFLYGKAWYGRATQDHSSQAVFSDLKQARRAYRQATELNPLGGNAWVGLARTCWWLSRFPGYTKEKQHVLADFQKAVAIDPNNGAFRYAVVNYLLGRADSQLLDIQLQKLAAVYPPALGYLQQDPRWSPDLLQPFERGLRQATANPRLETQALNLLASLAAKRKDWQAAIHYTKASMAAAGADSNPGPAYIRLGFYQLQRLDSSAAGQDFLAALKRSKNRAATLRSLLGRFARKASFPLYLKLCRETAKFDPQVRDHLDLIVGKAYYADGDIELAHMYFQKSLQNRETTVAHRFLAEIAMRQKDWETAELQSQRMTVLEPQNSYGYYLFARALEAQGQLISALHAIGEAIAVARPPNAGYYAMQGALNRTLQNTAAAERSYQAALKLNPRDTNLQRQLQAIRKDADKR